MEWIVLFIILIVAASILSVRSEKKQAEERGEKLNSLASSIPDFTPTVTIDGISNRYRFMVDNVCKKVCYIIEDTKKIIPFDKIISVEYLENGTTLSSKSTMRTIGGTLVGGVIAGGAGAVVGGLSGNSKQVQKIKQVQVKIRLRDISEPSLVITTFDAATMTSKPDGVKESNMEGNILKQGIQDGKRITDIVSVIIDEVDKGADKNDESPVNQHTSVADELKKLADLKNEGILTEEEFRLQKSKILGNALPNED